MKKLLKALPEITVDGIGLIGAGSISYGAWAYSHPLGFIVAGCLMLTGAYLSARAGE